MKPARLIGESQPSPLQLAALHSLFRVYSRRILGSATVKREERLAWAADRLNRPLASFAELTADEAATLIDLMKGALGQTVTPPKRRGSWQRPDRDQARAYGTAGRRGQPSKEIRLVDLPTLELVDRLRTQLGWSPARLEAFLKSSKSPVSGGMVRTLPEANGVIWAMRKMLRRADERTRATSLVSDQSSLSFGTCPKEG